MRMIERVKGLAMIRGYRNLPRGDVKALARAVSDFSRLALVPGRPVAEAEINPLIVKADCVVAVDARSAACGTASLSPPGADPVVRTRYRVGTAGAAALAALGL